MRQIEEIVESLHLKNQLTVEDLPNLDLYMDQVIQLFERKFSNSKRNEEEKVLTKTMINNYAKGKLFFPIKNKKYSKEHILLISMIYQLKGALSIKDIKNTLEPLNNKIIANELDLETFYQHYLILFQNTVDRFLEDITISSDDVKEEANQLDEGESDYLEQLLLVTTLVQMSNLYRRVAEKMVDDITKSLNSEEEV